MDNGSDDLTPVDVKTLQENLEQNAEALAVPLPAPPPDPWAGLERYARRTYSQCGEEGILERIFEIIGTTNKISVEFGAGDGYNLSNTRSFMEQGWTGHLWDCAHESVEAQIKRHFITAENINSLFEFYAIPRSFDLLSLDIDGNDYWVWKALEWRPRVVVIEFNGTVAVDRKCTVPYDPNFRHDGTDYYGASFALLCHLGQQKGYVPVAQINSLNLFFVRKDLAPESPPRVTYVPQQGHPPDPQRRPWVLFP